MRTFLVELTEEQAQAVGFAIKRTIRDMKKDCVRANRNGEVDDHAEDLKERLESAYHQLDTAPEIA